MSEGMSICDFEEDLRTRFGQRSFTVDHAITYLHNFGILVSKRTLERRMAEWGIQRRGRNHALVDEKEYNTLIEQIGYMYHHFRHLNDEQIARRLQEDYNLPTTSSQVRTQRLKHNWRRRAASSADAEARRVEVANFIAQLLDEGGIRQYGRRQLLTRLSRKYELKATGRDVRHALKLLDSCAVASRRPGMSRKRRMNYEVAGPDWLWCIDGHDKLQKYGIEIYGCVDAYSRKIIWWYVGLSNRTGVSVACQYLQAIKEVGRCPNFIRSDHGSETTLLADHQYHLYYQACEDAGYAEEELDAVCLLDCYLYGKSTRNIRIEAMWNQMISSVTESWIDYLAFLRGKGLYREEILADRVVLLYILLPIIQKEIFDWVLDHNANPIRPQAERSRHVAGVPNELYQCRDRTGSTSTKRYGFLYNESCWQACSERYQDYNPTELLTPATQAWCHTTLQEIQNQLGVTEEERQPQANQFITRSGRRKDIPYWYQCLVHTARNHARARAEPRLQLAAKPYAADEVDHVQSEVIEAMAEARLFESGVVSEEDEARD
jgi:hypothetical protein